MESQVDHAHREVRFIKLLPKDADFDLILLKGHLLLEELLTEILIHSLDKTNPINIKIGNNTSFNQKLNLCWALNKGGIEENIWESLKELNSIRNTMAHNIEPKDMSEKASKFNIKVLKNSEFKSSYYKGQEFKFSLSWLFIVLSSYLHAQKNS